MLARKIYEQAYKSPGLSRVPPNILVGEGATDFAWNNGIIIVPDDALITPSARDRWKHWCRELSEYERDNPPEAEEAPNPWLRRPLTPISSRIAQFAPPVRARLEAGIAATRVLSSDDSDVDQLKTGKSMDGQLPNVQPLSTGDVAGSAQHGHSSQDTGFQKRNPFKTPTDGEDSITDTVGAIAIDMFGNIAAGSSSGGIGMKHRGRVGPAALIGIGTHVIPVDPTDSERTTTAVVTSGTGEHIASTLAASTCANRIYYSQKMGRAGVFEQVTEDEAIGAMIKQEFIGVCLSFVVCLSTQLTVSRSPRRRQQ